MLLICGNKVYYYFCKIMAGIYLHIPFCKKRCSYCDFYSTTDNSLAERYIESLIIEFNARSHEITKDEITTIYIGGGTPSQLTPSQLSKLADSIKNKIDFSKIIEFTIEVNPDDVTFDYILMCKNLGINRVSMGIQSFVDDELSIINRRHDSKQAYNAVELIRNAGIDNISIDLIYGLPLQTIESWKFSVREAIKLGVPHISCYNLSYEEGTLLYNKREAGEIKECCEEDCIKMYDILIDELKTAGYVHYEISNFAKPDSYSRHNSSYWQQVPYLGLGASAHSYDGNVRRYNPSSIHKYMTEVGQHGVAYEEEIISCHEKYNEYIMLGLRTIWGLNTQLIKKRFGNELYEYLIENSRKFVKNGDIIESRGVLTLSDKGMMLSDYIMRTLFYIP